MSEITEIAAPAMLTQLATPFANAYATRAVAEFGNEVVGPLPSSGASFPSPSASSSRCRDRSVRSSARISGPAPMTVCGAR
jgi:hypothetical protein